MANYKGTDTDLIAVANAIRVKAETTASLMWPDDYIIQIGNLKKDPLAGITIGATLNDTAWSEISKVAERGLGDQVWDIGDCKEIVLNGKIGDYLTLSNYITYVYIIDFNHPINKTTPDNNIIFGGFKNALTNGIDIALCDAGYGSVHYTGNIYIDMNHAHSTCLGGYQACDLRYDILGTTQSCPTHYKSTKTVNSVGVAASKQAILNPISNTLMSTLPEDFRTVLKLWPRFADSYGNLPANDLAHLVTSIIDAGVSLLAEFEIFGTRTRANSYEQDHQRQILYYSEGNSKIKYNHTNFSSSIKYWLCSPSPNNQFCYVTAGGGNSFDYSTYSYGLAPIFKV